MKLKDPDLRFRVFEYLDARYASRRRVASPRLAHRILQLRCNLARGRLALRCPQKKQNQLSPNARIWRGKAMCTLGLLQVDSANLSAAGCLHVRQRGRGMSLCHSFYKATYLLQFYATIP